MDQIYSSWKMLKHLEQVKNFLGGNGYPVCLQIDLTNRCNYSCLHCSEMLTEDYLAFRNADLDFEALKKFLSENGNDDLKSIQFTGGGEPTIHPQFAEIAAFTRSNFEMGLVTNGSRLHDAKILNSIVGSHWIRISVDAATKEMYERIHDCSCREVFERMPETVVRIKSLSPNTILGFSFVITNLNFREIVPATKFAKQNGFDNLRFSGDISAEGTRINSELLEQIHRDLAEAKKLEDGNFKIFLMKERTSDAFFQDRPSICYYAMVVGVIAATGEMYLCCQRKNHSNSRIGSIYKKTLAEIYRDQEPIRVEECVPCWMDAKNHLIEYYYREDPLHANFP